MTDLIEAQPGPQYGFLACEADIAFYGGQAGGGKTFAVIMEGSRHVENSGFRAVYFRETRPQIRALGGLWDTSTKIWDKVGGIPREHTLDWRFPSGAKIKMDFCQYESDKYRHDGAQYALIVWDEVQHSTEGQFFYIAFRANRTTCGVAPYVRCTCNPDVTSWVRDFIDWWIGPDGKAIPERSGVVRYFTRDVKTNEIVWVDKDWCEHDPENPDHPKRPKSFTFIAAKLSDNPALLSADPGYLDSLRQLPDDERQRLLDGNWNATPKKHGLIYPEFDRAEHFIKQSFADYLATDQLDNFRSLEGHDFGTGATAATAIVWAFYDESTDRMFVWDICVGYEHPVEWYAERIGEHGYFVQNRKPHEYPGFRDNTRGRVPYDRIGDPAGKQRDSEQRHWFGRLYDDFGIELRAGVNKPNETIQTVRWALSRRKLMLHPRLAEKLPMGPRRKGSGREMKSLADAFSEYVWKTGDDYDAARDGDKPGANQPKKNWASHVLDALGYLCRDTWGFVARGSVPRT